MTDLTIFGPDDAGRSQSRRDFLERSAAMSGIAALVSGMPAAAKARSAVADTLKTEYVTYFMQDTPLSDDDMKGILKQKTFPGITSLHYQIPTNNRNLGGNIEIYFSDTYRRVLLHLEQPDEDDPQKFKEDKTIQVEQWLRDEYTRVQTDVRRFGKMEFSYDDRYARGRPRPWSLVDVVASFLNGEHWAYNPFFDMHYYDLSTDDEDVRDAKGKKKKHHKLFRAAVSDLWSPRLKEVQVRAFEDKGKRLPYQVSLKYEIDSYFLGINVKPDISIIGVLTNATTG